MEIQYIKKFNVIWFFGLLSGFALPLFLLGQTINFNGQQMRENILQVAEHYAQEGDWKQAIMNYYAFLYRFPDDSAAVIVHLKIVEMYKRSGQLTLAESNLRQVIEKYQNTNYDLENRLRLALFLYDQERWAECLKYAYYQPEPPFQIIVAYNLIRLGEIEMADSILAIAQERTGMPIPIYTEVHKLVIEPLKLTWYQKWGGLAMSAVLPGSGRIYYREYRDGLFNIAGFGMLLSGTFYIAYYQTQWFFYASAATLAYYFANLYATYEAGERFFNRYKDQRYVDIIKEFPLIDLIPLRRLY